MKKMIWICALFALGTVACGEPGPNTPEAGLDCRIPSGTSAAQDVLEPYPFMCSISYVNDNAPPLAPLEEARECYDADYLVECESAGDGWDCACYKNSTLVGTCYDTEMCRVDDSFDLSNPDRVDKVESCCGWTIVAEERRTHTP